MRSYGTNFKTYYTLNASICM